MTTTTEVTSADLIGIVTAIPGVRGLEPGVASTLRTLDARIRSLSKQERFGVIIDPDGQRVTIEVGFQGTRPVREVVAKIQRAVIEARAKAGGPTTVHVRVQSLTR